MRHALLVLASLPLLVCACGERKADAPASDARAPASARPVLAPGATRRPIVLVSIDSLRADHLSCFGRSPEFEIEEPTTPFLDRVAREGVRFAQAQAPTSWTLPSHVSLLTGMPSLQHGVRTRATRLDPKVETLAGRLRAAGWLTAGFYSAPFLHPAWGFGQGFDTYRACAPYLQGLDAQRAIQANTRESLAPMEELAHADARTAERVVDQALAWLEQDEHRAQPFFLFLHVWDPHYDYEPPPELARLFVPVGAGALHFEHFLDGDWEPLVVMPRVRALYDAEIRYVDRELERFWSRLEAWGLADATVLAVVSDHGDEFLERGARGHHKTLYQEVVRVPMLLRAKDLVPAGRVVEAPVALWDMAPTLLDLAGLESWPERDGRSLRGAWEDPPRYATRGLAMDLLLSKGPEVLAWREGALKLHWSPRAQQGLLFDLERDPGERAPRLLDRDSTDDALVHLLDAVDRLRASGGAALPMQEGAAMSSALRALGYTDGAPEDSRLEAPLGEESAAPR